MPGIIKTVDLQAWDGRGMDYFSLGREKIS